MTPPINLLLERYRLLFRPDNGGQTGAYNDAEGDSQYLRDLLNYNSSESIHLVQEEAPILLPDIFKLLLRVIRHQEEIFLDYNL